MRIVIIFASQTGRTRRLAEAVADGARDAGAEVVLEAAADADPRALEDADAVILGSGVHMGGIESEMRAFLERTATLWLAGRLAGRLGAAFVTGGSGGRGGAELALISLLSALAEHGLLLVSMHNRLPEYGRGGSQWGPVAETNPSGGEPGPSEAHLAAARGHGLYVAECAARWARGADGDAGRDGELGA